MDRGRGRHRGPDRGGGDLPGHGSLVGSGYPGHRPGGPARPARIHRQPRPLHPGWAGPVERAAARGEIQGGVRGPPRGLRQGPSGRGMGRRRELGPSVLHQGRTPAERVDRCHHAAPSRMPQPPGRPHGSVQQPRAAPGPYRPRHAGGSRRRDRPGSGHGRADRHPEGRGRGHRLRRLSAPDAGAAPQAGRDFPGGRRGERGDHRPRRLRRGRHRGVPGTCSRKES